MGRLIGYARVSTGEQALEPPHPAIGRMRFRFPKHICSKGRLFSVINADNSYTNYLVQEFFGVLRPILAQFAVYKASQNPRAKRSERVGTRNFGIYFA